MKNNILLENNVICFSINTNISTPSMAGWTTGKKSLLKTES